MTPCLQLLHEPVAPRWAHSNSSGVGLQCRADRDLTQRGSCSVLGRSSYSKKTLELSASTPHSRRVRRLPEPGVDGRVGRGKDHDPSRARCAALALCCRAADAVPLGGWSCAVAGA